MTVRAFTDPDPATRADLLFRKCVFQRTAHCAKCKRKVELWMSGRGKPFYVDVQPTGEAAVVTMHRDTCPKTTHDMQQDAHALMLRHDAALVVVIGKERTAYAYNPNCSAADLREALRDATNNLDDHIRNTETR